MPVARLRMSSRPSACHVLVDHSGMLRELPWYRRPAVTARVAGLVSGSWSLTRTRGYLAASAAHRPGWPPPTASPNVRAMDITGASAIVTGGASGIGAASARLLAARGAKVVVADLQEDKGKALADEIGGSFCKVDVTDTDDIINAVEMAKSMGPVRVLINSAGIGAAQRTVGKDGSHESAAYLGRFKKLIAINLTGTF